MFDEFHNFSHIASEAYETLQKLWDRDKDTMKLLLVVIGSSTHVMRDMFENGRAPLFSRQDTIIELKPFSPALIKHIFSDFCPTFSGEDLLALYALTGGVAQYLTSMVADEAFRLPEMTERLLNTSNRSLSELTIALTSEFKGSAVTYFEILRLITSGKTKRLELQSSFSDDISGHLQRLETIYGLIERTPFVGTNGAQRHRMRFSIADELVNFWFSFIDTKEHLIESGQTEQIKRFILSNFSNWSGRVLEHFYRRHFLSLGKFTEVGSWWDRKGENEIDLIAVDDVESRILFAEVKRNPQKINLEVLKFKSAHFLSCNPKYASYHTAYTGLSLDELTSSGKLPDDENI